MDEEEIGLDSNGAWAIATKVVEMCDRVRVAHACSPGARAAWGVEIDGHRYKVIVTYDGAAE